MAAGDVPAAQQMLEALVAEHPTGSNRTCRSRRSTIG